MRAAAFDEARALAFVELCRVRENPRPHLRDLYYAAILHEATGQELDLTDWGGELAALQNPDGGFGLWTDDRSTVSATFWAVALLRRTKDGVPKPKACGAWLRDHLKPLAEKAGRVSDLATEREIFRGLMALAALEAKVPQVDRYLRALAASGGPEATYQFLRASEAFDRPVKDRRERLERVREMANDLLLRQYSRWPRIQDQHCLVASAAMLDGQLDYAPYVRMQLRWVGNGPWGPKSMDRAELAWRTWRMARVLKKDTPWLTGWLEEAWPPKPTTGLYAPMPTLDGDHRTSLAAWRLLEPAGRYEPVKALAENLEAKREEDGWYNLIPAEEWEGEADRRKKKLEGTFEALVRYGMAGTPPPEPEPVGKWLATLLRDHLDEMSLGEVLMAAKCFALLDGQGGGDEALTRAVKERATGDPVLRARGLALLGKKPKPAAASVEPLETMLRRAAEGNAIGVSVWGTWVETLHTAGRRPACSDRLLAHLAVMQNPDGGVGWPHSPHSNLFSTVAAIRTARILRSEK